MSGCLTSTLTMFVVFLVCLSTNFWCKVRFFGQYFLGNIKVLDPVAFDLVSMDIWRLVTLCNTNTSCYGPAKIHTEGELTFGQGLSEIVIAQK